MKHQPQAKFTFRRITRVCAFSYFHWWYHQHWIAKGNFQLQSKILLHCCIDVLSFFIWNFTVSLLLSSFKLDLYFCFLEIGIEILWYFFLRDSKWIMYRVIILICKSTYLQILNYIVTRNYDLVDPVWRASDKKSPFNWYRLWVHGRLIFGTPTQCNLMLCSGESRMSKSAASNYTGALGER